MKKRRADGWWYPWIFVAAMGIVVLVNGTLVAFALGSWTGLETEGHYDKGLAYNRDLAAARAQAERGWRFQLAVEPADAGNGRRTATVSATFADDDGAPLDDLDVQAVVLRPTNEGLDQEVRLPAVGNGVYRAAVGFPAPGQWDVRIHAYRGDVVFQESRRIRLR